MGHEEGVLIEWAWSHDLLPPPWIQALAPNVHNDFTIASKVGTFDVNSIIYLPWDVFKIVGFLEASGIETFWQYKKVNASVVFNFSCIISL